MAWQPPVMESHWHDARPVQHDGVMHCALHVAAHVLAAAVHWHALVAAQAAGVAATHLGMQMALSTLQSHSASAMHAVYDV
jgi:hypothetical protein